MRRTQARTSGYGAEFAKLGAKLRTWLVAADANVCPEQKGNTAYACTRRSRFVSFRLLPSVIVWIPHRTQWLANYDTMASHVSFFVYALGSTRLAHAARTNLHADNGEVLKIVVSKQGPNSRTAR